MPGCRETLPRCLHRHGGHLRPSRIGAVHLAAEPHTCANRGAFASATRSLRPPSLHRSKPTPRRFARGPGRTPMSEAAVTQAETRAAGAGARPPDARTPSARRPSSIQPRPRCAASSQAASSLLHLASGYAPGAEPLASRLTEAIMASGDKTSESFCDATRSGARRCRRAERMRRIPIRSCSAREHRRRPRPSESSPRGRFGSRPYGNSVTVCRTVLIDEATRRAAPRR